MLSKSQVNRLGDRLKRSPSISEEDRVRFDAFREGYAAPMRAVAATLTGRLGVEANPRLKTVGTIIDKLRREQGSHLASIQDIAGVRIVRDMSRREQDVLVAGILEIFPGGKVKDRRAEPSFGYRAVHVVVVVNDLPVEIQVRTQVQHAWAEMIEKVGDRWGREVRYGGVHPDPGVATLVSLLGEVAELFASIETMPEVIEEREKELEVNESEFDEAVMSGQIAEPRITEFRQAATSIRESIQELRGALVRAVERIEAEKQNIIDLLTRDLPS
jgi:ppGpp synthetase/RelA/SpoT-type nucleotidyltranferase